MKFVSSVITPPLQVLLAIANVTCIAWLFSDGASTTSPGSTQSFNDVSERHHTAPSLVATRQPAQTSRELENDYEHGVGVNSVIEVPIEYASAILTPVLLKANYSLSEEAVRAMGLDQAEREVLNSIIESQIERFQRSEVGRLEVAEEQRPSKQYDGKEYNYATVSVAPSPKAVATMRDELRARIKSMNMPEAKQERTAELILNWYDFRNHSRARNLEVRFIDGGLSQITEVYPGEDGPYSTVRYKSGDFSDDKQIHRFAHILEFLDYAEQRAGN